MASEDRQLLHKFKRKLEELGSYRGRATELISLYIPPERQVSDVTAYLRNELSQSSNIKSKGTRKNVTSAISSIISKLKAYRTVPENGLAIFVGHVEDVGDQTKMISEIIEPPQKLDIYSYRCDSLFFLEPLEDMIETHDVYGLIVIDRKEAAIGYLKGKRVEPIWSKQSRVPSKHSRGGWSQKRFERLIDQATHEFFKEVGDKADEIFSNADELEGIFLGGPGFTKDEFYRGGFLRYDLEEKVIDLFDTGYTDEYGLRELVSKASESMDGLDIAREKKLLVRFFTLVVKGAEASYGYEDVEKSLGLGKVETLLISEKFEESSKVGEVDHLIGLADHTGAEVRWISAESEEGKAFLQAFGGLGALLRY
jgi:peptide chain release factor subunit 1